MSALDLASPGPPRRTTIVQSILTRLDAWENRTDLASFGALFLRIVLATYWGVHWVYKVIYQGMTATEATFTTLGFYPWLAWGDVAFELVAVFALLLGFYVRTISLLLLVILLPSLVLWIPNGLWAIHGGYEFPLMWIFMQVTLALTGAGPYRVSLATPANDGKSA